jgi:hypothetical protein
MRAASPFGGMGIPDPRDVAARDRVARSWRRRQAILGEELNQQQSDLDALVAAMEGTDNAEDLDPLVREAARLDADLSHTVADIERMQSRVLHLSTGRPWVDGMLNRGFRRRAVRRLVRRQRQAQEHRKEVASTVGSAVQRGAMPPGKVRELPGGQPGPRPRTNEPGPGNWLAGLPEAQLLVPRVSPSTSGDPIEPGSGWVERVYEGPLALPSATWSDDLVAAIGDRYPQLDETDVRILLGLVRLAYQELQGREAVESAVWRSLESGSGLRIRGEEATLSELWLPGSGRSEQPVVTFVLTLLF